MIDDEPKFVKDRFSERVNYVKPAKTYPVLPLFPYRAGEGQVSRRTGTWFPVWFAPMIEVNGERRKNGMFETPEKNGWQREEDRRPWWISIIGALVITAVLFRVMRPNPVLLLLTFVILVVLILQVVGFRPRRLAKLFPAPPAQMAALITGVLDTKGLPYRKVNGRIYLEGSPLRIELTSYAHKGLAGSLVCLAPYTGSQLPLIVRLCQQIDEAFAAAGD